MFVGWLVGFVGVVLTGGLWYSPSLFGDVWARHMFKGKPPSHISHGGALAATLPATGVAVFVLGQLLNALPVLTSSEAAGVGLLLGAFMFFQQVSHTAFNGKAPLCHLIDSSHDIVCAVVAVTALNYFEA